MQNDQPTRVFVQRDYSMGTVVQFETKFPSELNGHVSKTAIQGIARPAGYCPDPCNVNLQVNEDTFRSTVSHINQLFEEAEALDREAYVEGCLACLTLCTYYAWPCVQTKYEKVSQGAWSTAV